MRLSETLILCGPRVVHGLSQTPSNNPLDGCIDVPPPSTVSYAVRETGIPALAMFHAFVVSASTFSRY